MTDPLITAFRAKDPNAVRVVYRQFAGPIATVARSIVGNDQELIDDVVQVTFTKAWQSADRFDAGRDLAPWLYAIARRTAIDTVRFERRPTRGGHEPEVDQAVAPASLERTWETFEVRKALETLPPEEQKVVRLQHELGLTQGEVAEHLGVPVGTVKSRSHRAYRRLAKALAHVAAEPTEIVGADDGTAGPSAT